MARWNRAQVEQFAPDDKSIKAARKLALPGPWSETGSTDTLVWGKCQGSGKTPYQVSVDLTGPAAKCTCPSRKFPCKHGIALLMLWVDSDGAIAEATEAADFASDWAQGRADRAATKSAKSEANEPPDPEAQAKRLERRLELMTSGATDFELWLADLYRKGFAAARQQPYSFWEEPAARLLDSQLPGLAQRVRDMPSELYTDDWADRLLSETGRWFTAVRAWQRREHLSESDFGNLRAYLGWNWSADEIRAGEHVAGSWQVEGVHRTDDGRLKAQRTWLKSTTTGERALVLDFAAASANLATTHIVGAVVDASIAFYPGSGIRRALFVDAPTAAETATTLDDAGTVAAAIADASALIAKNPFVDQTPASLRASVRVSGAWAEVVDEIGDRLHVATDFEPWHLLAHTGGAPATLFGELAGGAFRPLSVATATELIAL